MSAPTISSPPPLITSQDKEGHRDRAGQAARPDRRGAAPRSPSLSGGDPEVNCSDSVSSAVTARTHPRRPFLSENGLIAGFRCPKSGLQTIQMLQDSDDQSFGLQP